MLQFIRKQLREPEQPSKLGGRQCLESKRDVNTIPVDGSFTQRGIDDKPVVGTGAHGSASRNLSRKLCGHRRQPLLSQEVLVSCEPSLSIAGLCEVGSFA